MKPGAGHGSLKSAADALAITPAAVGQRIKALEDYLGVDLLMRGRSGLAPTPTLAPALRHLRAAFQELDAVSDALQLQRGHEIHVAATSDLADLWLRPRLSRFQADHPNVAFCINGEPDAPLRLGAVDCELTFGPTPEGELRDVLFRDFTAPISSPENRRRIAGKDAKERLEGFPLLHLDVYREDPAAPNWASWIKANGLHRTAPERGVRFQRIAPAVDAVLADAGLAICGLALLRDAIGDCLIVLPFPVSTGSWTSHAYQARFRADALLRPQVRRFRTWLLDEAHETAVWLSAFAAQGAKPPRDRRRKRSA